MNEYSADVLRSMTEKFELPRTRFAAFFIGGLIFLSAFLTPHGTFAAFGISPPFLNADHLVKGARYTQTIYLVRDNPDADLPIKAALDISQKIRPWITIDKGFDFVIPKGVQQFPVELAIQVPADAALGVYSGSISFTGNPSKAGQVTIALGAQVAINLTVGTGIYRKFSVPLIRLLDIEEGWGPKVYVRINNEGNIAESFTGATYELFDQFGGVRLAYAQKTKGFPEAPAFTVTEDTIEFPIDFHLGIGQYWGSVNFYQNDKLIASQRTVFNVLKKGAISGTTAQIIDSLRRSWPLYGGGIAILGAVIFFARRKFFRM